MKNNLKIIVFSMLFIFLFIGCKEETKIDEANTEQQVYASTEEKGEENNAEKQERLQGYLFIEPKTNTKISINSSFAKIYEMIGKEENVFEAESCALQGLNKIYEFQGFVINTFQESENKDEIVLSLLLKDDTVSTAENITIGDSKEKVIETYGKEYDMRDNSIVYAKDDMVLVFLFADNDVISIEYRSNELENLG